MLRAYTFKQGGALIVPHPIVRLLNNTFEGHPSGALIQDTASLSHIEKSIQNSKRHSKIVLLYVWIIISCNDKADTYSWYIKIHSEQYGAATSFY